MSHDFDRIETEAARATWQFRAIELTRGQQSQTGCILLAILGKGRLKYPRYGASCTIDTEGIVRADAWNVHGDFSHNAVIGRIDELIYRFQTLADDLKLTDGQKIELFEKLRGWVRHDYRVKPEYKLN